MSKDDAKKTIDKLCKKYFYVETENCWFDRIEEYNEDLDYHHPPHWNIFALKNFTRDELYMLGMALTELANE